MQYCCEPWTPHHCLDKTGKVHFSRKFNLNYTVVAIKKTIKQNLLCGSSKYKMLFYYTWKLKYFKTLTPLLKYLIKNILNHEAFGALAEGRNGKFNLMHLHAHLE